MSRLSLFSITGKLFWKQGLAPFTHSSKTQKWKMFTYFCKILNTVNIFLSICTTCTYGMPWKKFNFKRHTTEFHPDLKVWTTNEGQFHAKTSQPKRRWLHKGTFLNRSTSFFNLTMSWFRGKQDNNFSETFKLLYKKKNLPVSWTGDSY